MVSEKSKCIMKGIDNVRKHTDIECLLRNHHSEPEKDFIQKYAETKMAAIIVTNITFLTYSPH